LGSQKLSKAYRHGDVSGHLFFFIFVLSLNHLLRFELLDDKPNWLDERILETLALTAFIVMINTIVIAVVRNLVIVPNIHYRIDLACLTRY
jgi:hypothetical protein